MRNYDLLLHPTCVDIFPLDKEIAIEIECGTLPSLPTASTPQSTTAPSTSLTIPKTTHATTLFTTPYVSTDATSSAQPYDTCAYVTEGGTAFLSCSSNDIISSISFASYGLPIGDCATGFAIDPECDANNSLALVEGMCVGLHSCTIDATNVR